MHVLSLVLFIMMSPMLYAKTEFDLKERWMSAIYININENFKQSEIIEQPAGTKQYIFEVTYLNHKFLKLKDCLIYSIPNQQRSGEIEIVPVAINQKCEDHLYSKPIMQMMNVFNFGYKILDNKLVLKVDTKEIVISLLNYKYQKAGMLVSLSTANGGKKLLENGEICFDVDSNCKVTLNDRCHLCPNAILPAIASSCQTNHRKYCANFSCGEKDAIACIRGFIATSYKGDYCINDSPVAFCKKSARVMCIDGELRCR